MRPKNATRPGYRGGPIRASPLKYNLASPLEYNLPSSLAHSPARPLEYSLASPLEYNLASPLEYNLASWRARMHNRGRRALAFPPSPSSWQTRVVLCIIGACAAVGRHALADPPCIMHNRGVADLEDLLPVIGPSWRRENVLPIIGPNRPIIGPNRRTYYQ